MGEIPIQLAAPPSMRCRLASLWPDSRAGRRGYRRERAADTPAPGPGDFLQPELMHLRDTAPGHRPARQRSRQLQRVRVEPTLAARPASRVHTGRALSHHERQGRRCARDLPPVVRGKTSAGPVHQLPGVAAAPAAHQASEPLRRFS
jgi:hypothetical protein